MDNRKPTDGKRNETKRHDEDGYLAEEMDEIFHPVSDRFSLADLRSERSSDGRTHFNEDDYESHRKESLQYHQPLRRLHHKHRKLLHKPDHDESSLQPSKEHEKSEKSSSQQDGAEKLLFSDTPAPEIKSSNEDKVQFYVGSSSSLETSAVGKSPLKTFSSDFRNIKLPLKSVLRRFSSKEKPLSSGVKIPSLILPSIADESAGDARTLPASATETALAKPPESSPLPPPAPLEGKPKVTFLLGEEHSEEQLASTETPKKSRYKHSKKHKYDPVKRKHQGSDMESKHYNDVLEPEEAETLQTADIDDMASHRFEDPIAIRRHKIQDKNAVSSFLKATKLDGTDGLISTAITKKTFDREPHELFVELHELTDHVDYTDSLEWRQTARWIKYEEDVELGPDRWGKPHVPPLSFHSLLKLRQCLESGAVLLDLEERELTPICNKIVDCLIKTDQINVEQKEAVLSALLSRHRHVNEKSHTYMRRNSSGYGNLNMLSNDKNKSPTFSKGLKIKSDSEVNQTTNNLETIVPLETTGLMPNNNSMKDIEITISATKRKSVSYESATERGILKRVPDNAEGAAVLVGQLECLEQPAAVFVRLSQGWTLPYFLEIPICSRFLFVLMGPASSLLDYHEIGRSIGALMCNQEFHDAAYRAGDRKDLLHAINRFLDTSTVVPPGNWQKQSLLPIEEIRRKSLVPPKKPVDVVVEEEKEEKPPPYDPLKRTGRLFGGFVKDIKHRYPWYISDFLDGLNSQCIASAIFIYFAALSGAVTFGGLLGEKTRLLIGVSETLILTCVCGILFSLLSCQPLIILGTTGPLLLFDEILFQFCDTNGIDFLRMRVWVSFWTALIATAIVAFEGSALVRFFSRFMQEIFATIISLLFIVESLTKMYKIFEEHPLLPKYCGLHGNGSYDQFEELSQVILKPQPNTALLSTILMVGTFYIALFLRHFRNSQFLGRSARRALGDFGVPIAIVIMVLVGFWASQTYTQKLSVPEGLTPSDPLKRGWIISPLPIGVWTAVGSSVAGLLIFILLFMETQICELIISKRKLKKGSGFHFDMLLISYMEIGCALMGGPWQCAATVRSISHVASLTIWSKTHAPGEMPHIVEVKEQRFTNFVVSLLIGVSVLMAPILRKVPVAVLFGVFLYMGVSSLSGIQLYERILLIFMPTKHHPDFPYVRRVRTSKMHMYTIIQMVCIAVLWILKSMFPPGFPFGLLMLELVHYQIKRFFTKDEIQALDGESLEPEVKTTDDEPDFYEQIVV